MIFSTFPGKVVLGFALCDVSEFLSLMVASLCENNLADQKCLATSERVNQTENRYQDHTAEHGILPSPFT
jgi:hypothetical protein